MFLGVRFFALRLIPIFPILCWNPYFFLNVNIVRAAEFFENHGQEESTVKNSQINLPDLYAKDSLPQPLLIYKGLEGAVIKSNVKVDLENDQEKVEICGEKKSGLIGLKTFFSRSWKNVESDLTHTQNLTDKYGLELKYKMDSLPINFFFSHSTEESEDIIPNRSSYQGKQKKTYGTSLHYRKENSFNLKASLRYCDSQNLFDEKKETENYWYTISSSISPDSNLTITPTLSFDEYRYWYGERKETPSASLFITFAQILNVVDLSLKGKYSQTRNTDGSQDVQILDTSMALSWDAKNLFFSKISYSLELSYDQYKDKVCHNSSYNELSTLIKLAFNL
jgi:hypothetical protein